MFKSKYEAYEHCKSVLENRGSEVEAFKEISYGLQFITTLDGNKYTIRIYESKKNGVKVDLSMIRNGEIEKEITNIIYDNLESIEKNAVEEKGEVNLPKSFTVNNQEIIDSIKIYFDNLGAVSEKSELKHKDSIYTINNVKVTIFVSGKILIQGKMSKSSDEIYNDLLLIIKKKTDEEFKKDIHDYFEDTDDYSNFFEEVNSEITFNKGEEFLGKELFHYLNINDQITMLDAITLYEYARDNKIKFNNYAIIVRNFAIAYEGFLVKIFLDSNILTEEEYDSDVRTALGTKLSKQMILEYVKNPERHKEIAVHLQYVWQHHRNKNLHSDFKVPKHINKFSDAEHDVNDVKKAMQQCFEILDFEKMELSKYSKSEGSDNFLIENIKVEEALSKLVLEGFDIKNQKKAFWIAEKGKTIVINVNNNSLKIIAPKHLIDQYKNYFDDLKRDSKKSLADIEENPIIGTDESGKGDYFGPLVIAGVYADENIKRQLRSLGVDDSKKIKDSHIALLAPKIKEICKHKVVVIGNEKYNELYSKINNLNKLLAWGHARVIENILEETDCNIALSDQFGSPELIENALMKKGKNITLEQRPKAEENVVVAAASILARNEFVNILSRMSRKYDLEFPKGVSQKTKDIGKEFIAKYGKENLNKVAKLHFKTTKEL